jgi:prolipoprotein diacylglyceryltransferase
LNGYRLRDKKVVGVFCAFIIGKSAISIIVAMYFTAKNVLRRPQLWILDRVVIPVASGAIFVRLGNFLIQKL